MHGLFQRIFSLAIDLLVTWFIWRHYRNKTSPASARYSTFWPRFLTSFVDTCVLWPVTLISFLFFSIHPPKILAAIALGIENIPWLAYVVIMHADCGQTIGKMVTKVRVVDFRTEGPISFRQAFLRESIPAISNFFLLGYLAYAIAIGRLPTDSLESGQAFTDNPAFWWLTAIPGLWFLAEVLTMLTNPKRRALHDFIAGTVVIRTNCEPESQAQERLAPIPSVSAPIA